MKLKQHLHRPVYKVEWEKGENKHNRARDWSRERRRRDRHEQSEAEREKEIARRRRERERRMKRREEEEEKDRERDRAERKRKSEKDEEARKGVEEGEITGVPNDEDVDYLRTKRAKTDDTLMTRTGGAYIPPARLRMMQANITDKASKEYQRISWEALKKSINGLVNKVNTANLIEIVKELFQENIVRGRGLLSRSIITAQAASPTFTHVYAALVAVINTKFPNIGELILKRLVIQFKKSFRRNDKAVCLSSTKFIAHLVNQQVAHEIIVLEVLFLLLQNPSDDSVEISINFLKECGQKLTEVSPKAIIGVFDRLRTVLHEAEIDKRVQYMIEVMFAVRKDGFKDHPSVIAELDLVEEDDQFTHNMRLEEAVNPEDMLNVFKFDPEYEATEEKYKNLKREILEEDSSGSEAGSGSGSSSEESDSEAEGEEDEKNKIMDMTETNLVGFRRTVYLTIQSSLDFEECAHKLLKMEIKPGWESELCNMILDCCGQTRTYEKFFGLLAQRFCMLDKRYITPFQQIFIEQYETIHRLETQKLRNVAKFFSHLLHTDAISWEVISVIKLNEEDTTSSSRIFIKILFQDLSEYMGLPKLNDRLSDITLQSFFSGLLPRDNPRNTRFAINFFTSIGLGGLTDELRNHLKTMPRPEPVVVPQNSSESSSDSSSSSSDDSSDSDSSSSEEETWHRKKHNKKRYEDQTTEKKEQRRSSLKLHDKVDRSREGDRKKHSKRSPSSEESDDGRRNDNSRHIIKSKKRIDKDSEDRYSKNKRSAKKTYASHDSPSDGELYRSDSLEDKARHRKKHKQRCEDKATERKEKRRPSLKLLDKKNKKQEDNRKKQSKRSQSSDESDDGKRTDKSKQVKKSKKRVDKDSGDRYTKNRRSAKKTYSSDNSQSNGELYPSRNSVHSVVHKRAHNHIENKENSIHSKKHLNKRYDSDSSEESRVVRHRSRRTNSCEREHAKPRRR